jgi:L-aspartate oxidase
MEDVPGKELAPRDVVSRNVWRQMMAGHQVFVDARACLGPRFAARFPAITAICRAGGLDPAVQPLPIRPAAHYHMGGIAADHHGRTSIPGLWVAGEAACTGLHGANRLASNSLLEAAVMGQAVAEDIKSLPAPRRLPVLVDSVPKAVDPGVVRPIMEEHVGVLRDHTGLSHAVAQLAPMAATSDPALIGWMIAAAALARQESRGGHARVDFPAHQAGPVVRNMMRLDEQQLRFLPPLPIAAVGA